MAYKPESLDVMRARVAGEALLQLARGEPWSDIVAGIIVKAVHWVDRDRPILNSQSKSK